jgi:hypothetical protein
VTLSQVYRNFSLESFIKSSLSMARYCKTSTDTVQFFTQFFVTTTPAGASRERHQACRFCAGSPVCTIDRELKLILLIKPRHRLVRAKPLPLAADRVQPELVDGRCARSACRRAQLQAVQCER